MKKTVCFSQERMLNLDLNNFDKKESGKKFFFFNVLFFLFFFYFPVLKKPGSHCQVEGTLSPLPCLHGTQHAVFEYSVRKPLHS